MVGGATKSIGSVTTIINGGTPKSGVAEYWDGVVLWITPKDMGQLKGDYASDTSRKISEKGLAKSSAKLIPSNSVILSTRAPIGHLAINTVPMATNQGCRGLAPKETLDTKYLFYFLRLNVGLLNDLGSGTTFKELSKSALAEIQIPLPPLPEQKRIVAILDEALAGIDAAIANTEKNLANARALFASYLNGVFSQQGEDWVEKPVGELAEHCLGKMLDKKKNKGTLRPYLRNLNVRWFEFNLTDILEMRFEEGEEDRYSAKKGDVLICEGGYPGRAAIWPHAETIFFQKALHRVRFKESRWKGGQVESAGINRHRVEGESPLHERRSCSIMTPSHASAVREEAAKR